MTITDVQRLPGGGSSQYGVGSDYSIPFLVTFTDGYSEAALRLNTDDRLPKKGWLLGDEDNPVSTDTSVYADKIDFGLMEASKYKSGGTGFAIYTVTYKQVTFNFAENPLDRVDVAWGGAEDTEVVKYDVNGNAIVNSAGELYSPLPMRPIRGSECCITIRQTANPGTTVTLFSNSTNSTEIWGVGVENAIMGKIIARSAQEDATKFWEVSFPIKFRRDSWRLKLIDNGSVFLNDDGEQQSLADDLGNLKQTPTLLDGDGSPLEPTADPVIFPDEGYEINDKLDWSTLGLPNPFTWPAP